MENEADAKGYLKADDIEAKESEWKLDEYGSKMSESNADPEVESTYTSTILYVDQTTEDLTIDKLVTRLLKKSLTDETEIFWVDLQNQYIYCHNPCSDAQGDCCSTTDFNYDYSDTTKKVEKYSWHTWIINFNHVSLALVQNYIETTEDLDCGAVEITDKTTLEFLRENCKAKHKPLCMKGSADITDKARNIKHETIKTKQEISTKAGILTSRSEGRQLTDTGQPIEMCLTVIPAVIGN